MFAGLAGRQVELKVVLLNSVLSVERALNKRFADALGVGEGSFS